jgi:EAL domain-containing protein (putative c-di-GMP-specific phosphodiesterase class I)
MEKVTIQPLPTGCRACQSSARRPLHISTAFQPIVDVTAHTIFAYEALVRGPEGQPASWVFDQITEEDHYFFDQECRVVAIRNAARLGVQTRLSINFLPNAVYDPATCIQTTLRTANEVGFPLDRLIFEVTEHESVLDQAHVRRIIDAYRAYGFTTALDDYGVGHATAQLLLAIRPDLLKLDLALIRGVETDPWRQALIRTHLNFAQETGVLVIAEGIETLAEARALAVLGVTHMQGYYFARPGFETLPEVPEELFSRIH